jgi:seryl-tRNA synthetase
MQENMEKVMEKLKATMGDKMEHLKHLNPNSEEMQQKFQDFMAKFNDMSDEEKENFKKDLMKRSMDKLGSAGFGGGQEKVVATPPTLWNYSIFIGMILIVVIIIGKHRLDLEKKEKKPRY